MNKVLELIKKNLPYIVLILLGLYTLDLFRKKDRLHTELIGTTEKFKKITEYSANLERKYVTQEEMAKKVQKEWANEKEVLKGRIKVLSNATFLIREKARESNSSDLVYKGTNLKFVVNEIRYGQNGPPVGYVLIFDDGRVVSRLYNHTIDVGTAISREESNGRYNVVSKANYVLKSPSLSNTGEWFNKPYPLTISGGIAFIDPTEPLNQSKSFYFWSPKINANININPKEFAPGLGISLMGYGYSKRDLDFKLLQFGIQYGELRDFGLTFTPVLYRPFTNVLSNTYIGPGVSLDSLGQQYFFGVQLGF